MRTAGKQPCALIFGVSGQDGAYLCRFLLDKGYRVHGTSRNAEAASFVNLETLGIRRLVTIHSATPADAQSVERVVERAAPTEVYNLLGPSSVARSFQKPKETIEAITLGSANILKAIHAGDVSIRYYNAATSECFGDTGAAPADELTPFNPQSPYAQAKAEAFKQTAKAREDFGLFACSGIFFNHESPLRPEIFVAGKIIKGAARIAAEGSGALTLGNLDIRRDWGWAPEYVDAMWRMLQQPQPDDFVIATGKSHSLRDLTAAAFSHFDLDWRDHVKIESSLFRPTDIAVSAGDPSKAHDILKWRAKTQMKDVVRLMAEAESSLHAGLQ